MRQALRLHPDYRCPAVGSIDVEIARAGASKLTLTYAVTGNVGELRFPEPASPQRTDELWRHTCFEMFLKHGAAAGYAEFNFSPSSQWAAYRFDDYRSGMSPLEIPSPPRIEWRKSESGALLQVDLRVDDAGPWKLGLSAVIEDQDGAISYWALAHPPGRPDFHHADCFALELA